ncbi:MAG: T9SS C-terminal target domain-containing protein [Bacteroidetes bacterium]|nr:MAG: T9SS C-terminal target domain-containing protein [Bacteroidota bacterium]
MNHFHFVCHILFLFISVQAVAQLEPQARAKMEELNTLIEAAEQRGIDTRKERMSVRVAEVFLDYANWDEAHVDENTAYFDLVPIYRDSAELMAAMLPDFERQEVILLLEESIDFLQKLMDGEYCRDPVPVINWSLVKHEGDQLTYDDRPVFLEDYTWKPFVPKLTQYCGQLGDFFITPGYVIDGNGTINPNILNELDTKPSGTIGFIFINNQNVPDWALTKYGDEFVFRPDNNFTDYDIDHPGAKEMMGFLIDGTVGKMAGKQYTKLGYMLCNEPHWFTKQGVWATGGVSDYTIEKFRVWLKEKHQTIETLNALWQTDFNDFSEVTIDIPISGSLQGTPKWYDWCFFNMVRVTDWYTWMKSKIQENDPDAKTMLKIMPRLWEENLRDHGIDLEALTEMSEIIGQDGLARTNNMWGPVRWWEAEYAFDWREVTMANDFMKSVSPEKIMFNSEAHYLSSSRSRNLYEKPAYARAVYWLAHTFGVNATQTWFWPRLEDGSIRNHSGNGYAGSNCQQPRIVNELHSTIMDLNAHSEVITAMQRQRKPLRIFYSKTSAINKPQHMEEDVFDIYKEMIFEGVPLGFVTKNIIEKQDNETWDAILIYKTQYVRLDELNALQTYLDHGGTVIMDNVSLAMNEYGQAHTSVLTQSNGTLIVANTPAEIKEEAFNIVESKGLLPEFIIEETNGHGTKACQWKSVLNDENKAFLSIINFGNTNASLDIQYKKDRDGLIYRNLLNGTVIPKDKPIVLAPFELLFMEVTDSSALVKNTAVANVLYPNPTSDIFQIRFEQEQAKVEMQVFDMAGRLIFKNTYHEVSEISESLKGQPSGNYIIHLKMGEKSGSFMLMKSSG